MWVILEHLFHFHVFAWFPLFLLLLSASFILLWSESYLVWFQFLIGWGFLFGPTFGLSWRMFSVLLRRTCIFSAAGWNILQMPVSSVWSRMLLYSEVSLLSFCLDNLFNTLLNCRDVDVLYTVLSSISPFGSMNMSFTYFGIQSWAHQ